MTSPEKLNGPIVMSVLLHAGLCAVILVSPVLFPSLGSESWGSDSSSAGMNVKLVGDLSPSGIALPSPEVVSEKAAGNDSKGFYKTEPEPPAPPTEKAIKIPDANAKVTKAAKVPPTPDRPTKTQKAEPATDTPPNFVPYGDGGKPALAYGQFSSQNGSMAGQIGDSAFGTKYATYVNAMVRKISQNWLQGLVDSRIARAPRVYMSFDIERDGTISNIEIKQSSGNPSLDNSAKRALYASSRLAALPNDYAGSKVSVTFYFEYVK